MRERRKAMSAKKNTILFSALLMAASCTIGPDYTAPDINPPPAFVSQDVLDTLNESKNGQTDIATLWWEGFNDPLLNEIVLDALENNRQIAAATARLKEAQAQIALSGAEARPTLDAGIDGGVSQQRTLSPTRADSTGTDYGASLGLGIPLDIFGRTRRDVEAARANLEAAKAELNGEVLRVSADVTAQYLGLRGNQRQLELLRESVALQEQTYDIVNSRYEAGLSPELDLRRAETSVENLRADIPPLEETLLNARNNIATLSGQFPGAYEQDLTQNQPIPEYLRRIPQVVPLDVLRARPDVNQAEARLKEAIANIGVAEADYYPSFNLAGSIGISASGVSSLPVSEVLIASLSTLIQQVILDGGARDANLGAAKARAEEALALYEQSLLEASEDVEITLAALESSQKRQVSLERAVSSSQRSFSQAETLYQQGLISFLDVVDAQRSLASAEQALARERTNFATSIAELFQVLGSPIDLSESPAP